MVKKYIIFSSIVIFTLFIFSTVLSQPAHKIKNQKKWQLVFQDNFSGHKVDTSQWLIYDGPGHAGNGWRKPIAFSVNEGHLIITARMIDSTTLVSGGMASRINLTYGKFEFRVRTEIDSSGTTSGVVLTWPESEKWPQDGENDMYETGTEANRDIFKTFIHYGKTKNQQYEFVHKADAKKWHVVTMEWEPDEIRIYRDHRLVWTLKDKNAIPKVPHHLCLQLDAFKRQMGKDVKMYVDWVKVYKRYVML